MFLLRATDALAPELVRLWAERYRATRGYDLAMASKAWNHAAAMTAWQRTHKPKTPDLPTTPAQSRNP